MAGQFSGRAGDCTARGDFHCGNDLVVRHGGEHHGYVAHFSAAQIDASKRRRRCNVLVLERGGIGAGGVFDRGGRVAGAELFRQAGDRVGGFDVVADSVVEQNLRRDEAGE